MLVLSTQSLIPERDGDAEAPIMSPVISGAIETLDQGLQFLTRITDAQYGYDAQPYLSSSIGQHFRHWLDIFHALFQEGSHVDYNQRRRGHEVETQRQIAIEEILYFIERLKTTKTSDLIAPVVIATEVSLKKSKVCLMSSTFERELTFAALHANHHFAMAKVVTTLLAIETSDDFGLAPATATFIRGQ
ncbi:hypothetical protein A6E14_11280 [Vibrio genomosp. F10]|uniref:DinB-like domain-containing protein n=2 Tax=Vibrio genomosp. F10 TaxID=723171 RepID=A0A1B9QY12_9VIBR|nr:hypothetical protein A6E14_11280 [Vibrio genomosp. F10]